MRGCRVHVRWVDAENMSYEEAVRELEQADGVLVPGGFGSRGWEGKILACQVAREQEIPYLGICLGMHVAVSEFARHVCGMDGANSTEMDPETPYPVIDLLPEQKEIEDLGGTMRLGAQAVELEEGTRAREAYDEPVVHERHRHRYEVNNELRQQIVDGGLVVSGTFQDGRLVEIVELPDHPWFVASQFHPEFKSRPDPSGPALPRVRRRRAGACALAVSGPRPLADRLTRSADEHRDGAALRSVGRYCSRGDGGQSPARQRAHGASRGGQDDSLAAAEHERPATRSQARASAMSRSTSSSVPRSGWTSG